MKDLPTLRRLREANWDCLHPPLLYAPLFPSREVVVSIPTLLTLISRLAFCARLCTGLSEAQFLMVANKGYLLTLCILPFFNSAIHLQFNFLLIGLNISNVHLSELKQHIDIKIIVMPMHLHLITSYFVTA